MLPPASTRTSSMVRMHRTPRRGKSLSSFEKLSSARVRASVAARDTGDNLAGDRVNLLGLPRAELEAFVAGRLGAKPFRARQLMKWIYRRGAADFAASTHLSQDFRSQLAAVAKIAVPEIVAEQVSSDGTRKWMLRMDEVQGIETVYIPEPNRGTLCISSQVGCAMDCSFCSTAQQGFNRNLSVAEIVGQVWLAHRELTESRPVARSGADGAGARDGARRNITNIVFMGMGEPLA